MHITTRNLIERADLSDSIREHLHRNSEFGARVFTLSISAFTIALILMAIVF